MMFLQGILREFGQVAQDGFIFLPFLLFFVWIWKFTRTRRAVSGLYGVILGCCLLLLGARVLLFSASGSSSRYYLPILLLLILLAAPGLRYLQEFLAARIKFCSVFSIGLILLSVIVVVSCAKTLNPPLVKSYLRDIGGEVQKIARQSGRSCLLLDTTGEKQRLEYYSRLAPEAIESIGDYQDQEHAWGRLRERLELEIGLAENRELLILLKTRNTDSVDELLRQRLPDFGFEPVAAYPAKRNRISLYRLIRPGNGPAGDSDKVDLACSLPERIYLNEDEDFQLYYDNIFSLPTTGHYAVELKNRYGQNLERDWEWRPDRRSPRNFPLTLTVYSDTGRIVGRFQTEIQVVAPVASRSVEKILYVGATELGRRLQSSSCPQLKMLSVKYPKELEERQADLPEATWQPDVVLLDFSMGSRDLFYADDITGKVRLNAALQDYRTMLGILRKRYSKAWLVILLPTLPPESQDLFGRTFGSSTVTWRRLRSNTFQFQQGLLREFGRREADGIVLLPTHATIDLQYDFPRRKVPLPNNSGEFRMEISSFSPLPGAYDKQIKVIRAFLNGRRQLE